uniref:Uncharacterized protein n=1 Tax=Ananas comosus var. bracteatus TaxID=296719 RepID=A0A6V7Q6E3_ANACO|nr:unnamed protein product [Ananas comosus var. bracteatus]
MGGFHPPRLRCYHHHHSPLLNPNALLLPPHTKRLRLSTLSSLAHLPAAAAAENFPASPPPRRAPSVTTPSSRRSRNPAASPMPAACSTKCRSEMSSPGTL